MTTAMPCRCSAIVPSQPRRRSSGWLGTIAEQRQGIAVVIEDSPSLRDYPSEIFDRCYAAGRPRAVLETGCPKTPFPRAAPSGWRRYSTRAGCRVEPKAELVRTNVVRFRPSEYKLF